MNKPVLDPNYWKGRLEEARKGDSFHHAVYICHTGMWEMVEAKHREILAGLVKDQDSVLDVGCGYGRLLGLLPASWYGHYVGIDISPDFVDLARQRWPLRFFLRCDIREVVAHWKFDWAVMVSMRPMVLNNLGGEVWEQIEEVLRKSATRLLYLEMDFEDEGSVE